MAATTANRRARALADQRAAKERRQRYLVIGLAVVLVGVLALEVPKLMKGSGSGSGSSSSEVAAPAVATPSAPAPAKAAGPALRKLLRQPPQDVFQPKNTGVEETLGSVPTPAGLHDPFAAPSSSEAAVAPVVRPAPVKTPALPGTIVLGTPGAGKVAVQGWIVILASIPTAAGQSSATAFANAAQKAGIGTPSVLNSSNRRPLRGGYWVVYTGPYPTLTQVSAAATHVHRAGFTNAYIRELLVYKAKPATHKQTTKKKTKK